MHERRAGYTQCTPLAGLSSTLAALAVLTATDISLCTQAGPLNFIHQPTGSLGFFCDIDKATKWHQHSPSTAAIKVVNGIVDEMDSEK